MARRSYGKKSGRRTKRSPRGKRTQRKSAKHSKRGSRKIKNSPCATYKKVDCGSVDPNCGWVKKRGCSRRRGAATKSAVYEGPSFQPSGPPMRMRRRSRRHSRR